MYGISRRSLLTLALVGALVLSAGCSGIGIGGSDTDATDTGEPSATGGSTTDDGSSSTTEHGQSDATNGESAESDTTESESGDGHDHSHDHSHGNESDGEANGDTGDGGAATGNGTDANNETNDDSGELTTSSAESWGYATIVVDGTKLDLAERDEEDDAVGVADEKFVWVSAEEDVTLAEALSYFDVEASASQVTVDGEQYSSQDEGTTLTYRVNGEPVDPETYELETRDKIWMVVETPETNVSTPGEYISIDEPHAHGDMTFSVDGEEVNFSKERYQTNADHFHFEGGDGETWHAHSWSVTLEWALSSLDGITVENGTVTYDGTTYDADQTTITVNGESVEPGDYLLKNGDAIEVVAESE